MRVSYTAAKILREGQSGAEQQGGRKLARTFIPIVGRACMKHPIIDLLNRKVHIGDEVVVYSSDAADQNSVEVSAVQHGLLSYSLLTDLSSDVRRHLTT